MNMNNTTTSMLKNQQYSTCIESCNECAMACEACCTECMTNVKYPNDGNDGQMYDDVQRLCRYVQNGFHDDVQRK